MRPMIALLLSAATTAGALAAEQIDIGDGTAGVKGVLYRPAGPGPFPAVIAMHGCSGLMNSSGRIARRFADWGARLSGAGVAVIFPDSFSSRGLRSQCSVRERRVRSFRERVADAQAARKWVGGQSWVLQNRVSIMGWSSGANATLWAVRPRARPHDGIADFRSAVAFYPGCRRLGITAWSARVPTTILIGRADDWTPAAPCEQMVAGAQGRSARTNIIVYPGAYHDFDRPDYPVRVRTGLASSADGSGRAHVGTNPAARNDAIRRVTELLVR